jgi:hypothetical protein
VATQVFADEELARLREFPEVSRGELFRFFTLTPADVAFVAPVRGRGPADRLGLSVVLCTVPWLGFVPDKVAAAPPVVVERLADQLKVDASLIRSYGKRAQTRTEHLRLAAQYLGWRPAGALELKELDEFLLARAMEHDSPTLLFRLGCEYLISARVIRPSPDTVVGRVVHAGEQAQRETYDRLAHELTPQRCAELDGLLVTDSSIRMSRLRWLSTGPVEASAAAVKNEVEKLGFVRSLGADTLDLSVLPAERRRFLATLGRRLTPQALERRDPERRYPILLTVLAQSAADVLDEVVALFDQALSGKFSAAENRMREQLAERAKTGEDRQALLNDLWVGEVAGRDRPSPTAAAARSRTLGRPGFVVFVSTEVHSGCSGCGTGCASVMCSCPDRAATPTRPPICSRPSSGSRSATNSAAWSTSEPTRLPRWPR